MWFDLDGLMQQWQGKRVLVIGDCMVDIDFHTRLSRKSNEFEGNIYKKSHEKVYLGGAANVAQICAALGAEVDLVGGAGLDDYGEWLRDECELTERLHYVECGDPFFWGTTAKMRFFQDRQFICRIDEDAQNSLQLSDLQEHLNLDEPVYDALLLSDYQKGCFPNGEFVRSVIQLFRRHSPRGIVGINPKPATMAGLGEVGSCGISLVSMNDREYRSIARPHETPDQLVRRLGVEVVLHTMGEEGVRLSTWQGSNCSTRLEPVENPDIVGCGDAVFAAAMLARTATQDPAVLTIIAAAAGTAKAKKVGTVPITCEEIRRLLTPVEGRLHA